MNEVFVLIITDGTCCQSPLPSRAVPFFVLFCFCADFEPALAAFSRRSGYAAAAAAEVWCSLEKHGEKWREPGGAVQFLSCSDGKS